AARRFDSGLGRSPTRLHLVPSDQDARPMSSLNSFNARSTLSAGGKTYTYYDLSAASANGLGDISKLPMSLKVLLENLLRAEDGVAVKKADILAMTSWLINKGKNEVEIEFSPARVLMQDFTGVP